MMSAEEIKVLSQLIKSLDHPDSGIFGSRFILPVLWVVLVFVFTVLFQLTHRGLLAQPILVVIAGIAGVLVSWVFFYVPNVRQWPFIRPHISRDSIERRLQELET